MITFSMDDYYAYKGDSFYWDGHTTGLIGGKKVRDKHMRKIRKRSKVKNRR
jgi:hypothetical protein